MWFSVTGQAFNFLLHENLGTHYFELNAYHCLLIKSIIYRESGHVRPIVEKSSKNLQ